MDQNLTKYSHGELYWRRRQRVIDQYRSERLRPQIDLMIERGMAAKARWDEGVRRVQELRESRERLSAVPTQVSNVIAFRRDKPVTTTGEKRRGKVLHVDFKRGDA